ncbi:MAG: FmdB family zinc ribbon protein [Thermodesulfobacteriota bacterium]
MMPIYEYRCRKCEKVFERFQRMGEGGEKLVCPYCGEKRPEKMISGFTSSKGNASTSSCGPTGGSSRFT